MKKQSLTTLATCFLLFFFLFATVCNAKGFYWGAVISENIGYDQGDWPGHSLVWRMLAATRVRPDPGINPFTQEVSVSSSVTGTKKLYYISPLEEFSRELSAYTFVLPLYSPSPGYSWEGQDYTFSYDCCGEHQTYTIHICDNEIRQISLPGNISFDPVTRILTWSGLDEQADTVVVRIAPLKADGTPDSVRLAWESGHLQPSMGSYTLPDWGPPGEYALRFESREYRESDQQILNRSVLYSKITNQAQWSDPLHIKIPAGHIKALSEAVDPNRVWHVVYRDTSSPLERIIYFNRGNFTNPVTLVTASSTTHSLRYPSIAIDGNGIVHVLYVSETDLGDRLTYIKHDPTGWSDPVTINIPPTDIKALSIAAGSDGIWHAVYRSVNDEGENIEYVNSESHTPTTLATTNAGDSLRYPSIAVDGRGTVHVLYDLQSGAEDHLMYTRSNEGTWTEPTEITIPSTHIKALSVCADAYGTWHAIYRAPQGNLESIFYINSTGFSDPMRLAQSENSLRYPAIGLFDKGHLHVFYVLELDTAQHLMYTQTVYTEREACPFFKSAWPQAAWLRGIWGSSPSDIYVVGSPHCNWGTNKGSVLLHYDGSRWICIDAPTYNSLSDVWGSSTNDVFAVGAAGTVLHFDGSSWQKMDSGTIQNLRAVWGTSSSDVFVVGENSTILHYDGNNWVTIFVDPDDSADFYAVWGSSSNDIYVGGYDKLLHYNGSTWEQFGNPSSHTITGIWGTPKNLYLLDTFGGFYKYNGSNWQTLVEPTAFSNYGGGIWGSSDSDIFLVGSQKEIIHFDGSSWTTDPNPSYAWLSDIWGSSGTDVFVVGYKGTILHLDGTQWNKVSSISFIPDPGEDGMVDGIDLAYFASAFEKGEVGSEELSLFAQAF